MSIMRTASGAGLPTHAVLSDMDEVLGLSAGNALEIAECMGYLRNEVREPRLDAVVLALCTEMLVISGVESDRERALARCDDAVTSGAALERFAKMVSVMGGPDDFVDHYVRYLPVAPVVHPVVVEGILSSVDTRAVGSAIIELGGGRREVGETLDLSVGFDAFAAIGDTLDADRPLAVVHAASSDDARRAEANLRAAVELSDTPPAERPVVIDVMVD